MYQSTTEDFFHFSVGSENCFFLKRGENIVAFLRSGDAQAELTFVCSTASAL
jgi:hypothetical protein